jgi:hypothetical protein
MTDDRNDNEANKITTAQLEQAAAQLDDLTVARLRAARRRVLAATQARGAPRHSRWMPVSIAAAVAAIAMGVFALQPNLSTGPSVANVEAVDWAMAKDDPDLNDNELEFYQWLENEKDAG